MFKYILILSLMMVLNGCGGGRDSDDKNVYNTNHQENIDKDDWLLIINYIFISKNIRFS